MKVVVPFTDCSDQTIEALAGSPGMLAFVDVSSSNERYWEVLNGLWHADSDFAVVEQDIVVNPDTIASFDACDSDWCCAPYPYLRGDQYWGLGCTRFRTSLLARHPSLMDQVADLDHPGHGPKHWCTLDYAITRQLQQAGERCCTNHQSVGHLNPWPSHGCVKRLPVTVIMTVYNAGHLLQRAIDSVLAQTYPDWELLICDDGSDDPQVAQVLAGVNDRRVDITHYQPTVEERQATARYATLINVAASRARGAYISHLCGDDYYLPDRLERMVATLEDGGHDAVYGSQQLYEESDLFGVRETRGPLQDAYELVDLNSVLYRRTLFDRVGGFNDDPSLWRNADAHFFRRLAGIDVVFQPVAGGPTDCKTYRDDGVDRRVIAGLTPW